MLIKKIATIVITVLLLNVVFILFFTEAGRVWTISSIFAVLLSFGERPHVPRYDRNRSTDFFLIHENVGETVRYEFFVVANVPRNWGRMLEVVAEFNRQTITASAIENQSFNRIFYRETRWLTRDFRVGEPYPMEGVPLRFRTPDLEQHLNRHFEDLFLDTRYRTSRHGHAALLQYRFPRGGREEFERRVPDIHAFFADSEGNMPENAPRIEFERR